MNIPKLPVCTTEEGIKLMPELGITMIVTVYNYGHLLDDVASKCKKYGVKHHHLQLEGQNQKYL